MAERAERIKKGVDDAKSNAAVLEKTTRESEEILANARVEAHKQSQQSKKEDEAKAVAMIENAKKEAKEIIESTKKSLEAEKIKAVEEARKDITVLAMKAVEKLMASKPDLNNL